ncbi:hypothetical protein ABT354_19885 [Streptomyces sp. NPDC000594]|uniref:hypothetical protein n=1 Tax=Streptomyces sp. NPDC000594 TaxID=3154261 RepID=UPI003323A7BA
MPTLDDVLKAFDELPDRITNSDIAKATGRTIHGVRNWIYQPEKYPGFPGEDPPPGPRGTAYRKRDDVRAWYEENFPEDSTGPTGPTGIAETARRARPRHARMDSRELARILNITPRGVNYYATAYSPERSDNPFPQADDNGERDWKEVRAWIIDNAERERKAPKPTTRDARGLSAREQEALALVQEAEAAGTTVTPSWLAEQLDLKTVDSANRLLRAIAPHRTPGAERLRGAALAKAASVSTDMIKYYAKTYGPSAEDPFPPADEGGTRSVSEVKAWIKRRENAPRARRS